MRYLLILFVLYASACKTPMHGTVVAASAPFVRLTDGQVHRPATVAVQEYETKDGHWGKIKYTSTVYKPRILCGDTGFHFRQVAFFSPGGKVFGSSAHSHFAVKFSDGPVRTFVSLTYKPKPFSKVSASLQTFNFAQQLPDEGYIDLKSVIITTEKHHHVVRPNMHYYLQQGDTGSLLRYNYHNLKPMIAGNIPASAQLARFHHTRVVARISGIAGLAMMLTGMSLASGGGNAVATSLSLSGLAISSASGIVIKLNHKKMNKALYIADVRH